MATPNTTFKFSEPELERLERLAADLGCSRTQVLRIALSALHDEVQARSAAAHAFVENLFHRVPDGSTLMVGLDADHEPYLTIDGRKRLTDVTLIGQKVRSGKSEFVQVLLAEPETGLMLKVGAIQANTGGWLAILNPLPIRLAWETPNYPETEGRSNG
jgi:hypothetical protein